LLEKATATSRGGCF